MPYIGNDDCSECRHLEPHDKPGHGKHTPFIVGDAVGHSSTPWKVPEKDDGSPESIGQSLLGLCSRLLSALIDNGGKLTSS